MKRKYEGREDAGNKFWVGEAMIIAQYALRIGKLPSLLLRNS